MVTGSRNDASTRTVTTIGWSDGGGIGHIIGGFFVAFGGMLEWGDRRLSSANSSASSGGHHAQRQVVQQFDIQGVLLRRTDETVQVAVHVCWVLRQSHDGTPGARHG